MKMQESLKTFLITTTDFYKKNAPVPYFDTDKICEKETQFALIEIRYQSILFARFVTIIAEEGSF